MQERNILGKHCHDNYDGGMKILARHCPRMVYFITTWPIPCNDNGSDESVDNNGGT